MQIKKYYLIVFCCSLLYINYSCCSHQGRVGIDLHLLLLHESCAIGEQLNHVIAKPAAGSVSWELQTEIRKCKHLSNYVDNYDNCILVFCLQVDAVGQCTLTTLVRVQSTLQGIH